ncbi:hypothetical protein Poli38472_006010 [Pythium oligandrum]|uniref:Chorein N-terminal domain-containing protein n=1 Tax=Pythium oligandrum TaxID=41045 RepID=A0A8K1CRL0_PYTOL|nr:hypothetical protein Poli38472_006010 [Pythium oligandrum]|eukprot:TMW68542.1 hypothetical protein Poli38472_006010 [Pythium oligandrum]
MAAPSMMKDYLKKQLRYWIDNFKDDQLPRDFNSKTFSRAQLTLSKLTLKPDKLASLLHIQLPLVVTRATCSELHIKVPSWSVADKFVQEPLSLRMGDLFIEIKHIDECEDHVRQDLAARAKMAVMEADPLGSIASLYAFAAVINERLEILADNIYIKLFEKNVLRVRVEIAYFHARTTNALWQEMRDLTECVDRSPDGLLKTRFKFVSMQCSVYMQPTESEQPPLRLMRDHAIALRISMFGHRKRKKDNWETFSRVVDLNLETLPFDMELRQVRQLFDMCKTLWRWRGEAAGRHMHLPIDGEYENPLFPLQSMSRNVEKAPEAKPKTEDQVTNDEDDAEDSTKVAGFALQVTVRFTAHALVRYSSEHKGEMQFAVIAQHAAINWILHQNGAHEVHLTLHDFQIRHKDKVLVHLKPQRDAMQYKQLGDDTVLVKWQLQKIVIQIEQDLAVVVNEIYHSLNEVEQAASIKCGTCHQRISLDDIGTHHCTPASPIESPKSVASASRKVDEKDEKHILLDSTQLPKLRVVLSLEELEIHTDNLLFRTVQELMRDSAHEHGAMVTPNRQFSVIMHHWHVSTESKEFVGDAIFVPVLPLAFQMLECTLHGCGCLQQRPMASQAHESGPMHGRHALPQWPDRLFSELAHLSVKSVCLETKAESYLLAETINVRASFSDGHQICIKSRPQMSGYMHVERVRCQFEHHTFELLRHSIAKLQDVADSVQVDAITLFLAVLELRTVELTLLAEPKTAIDLGLPRFKGQFRHVGAVVDNQLGYLSLQTNFDFRALINSAMIRYKYEEGPTEMEALPPNYETKRERRRKRLEAMQIDAARRIQANFRQFMTRQRHQVAEQLRRLTHEDEDPAVEQSDRNHKPHEPVAAEEFKKTKTLSSSSLFGSPDDLVNPKKMVAAASVFKDGLTRYVKAKQHKIESEMTEFATQSKESAARLLPRYSAVKNLLTTKMNSSDNVIKDTEIRKPETDETPKRRDSTTMTTEDTVGDVVLDDELTSTPDEAEVGERREGEAEETVNEDENAEPNDVDKEEVVKELPRVETPDVDEMVGEPPSEMEMLAAALPSIVRLMVQVEEHRLCVPISPRESVQTLCKEIVRRFNEMFGHDGFISHVTLQNPHGGVFAVSDSVATIFTTENELFFAYPHEEDGAVKSLVHLNPSTAMHSPVKPATSTPTTQSTAAKTRRVGRKFARCSTLPLPLVVALLANESERDLLSYILKDGSYGRAGGGNAEEWPELALNASFLDPRREMLQVEVRWHNACLEVSNVDAFLLCLQQLGLCTARANSKYVGKILRDRLKMDMKNPLVQAACASSPEFQQPPVDAVEGGEDTDEKPTTISVSYQSLKEIVQEDFGVYLRTKE